MASIVLIPQPLHASEKFPKVGSARTKRTHRTTVPGKTTSTQFVGLALDDGTPRPLRVGDSLRLLANDLPYVQVSAFEGVGHSASPLMFLLQPTSNLKTAPTPVDRLNCRIIANPQIGEVVADLLDIVSPLGPNMAIELASQVVPNQRFSELSSLEFVITEKPTTT